MYCLNLAKMLSPLRIFFGDFVPMVVLVRLKGFFGGGGDVVVVEAAGGGV